MRDAPDMPPFVLERRNRNSVPPAEWVAVAYFDSLKPALTSPKDVTQASDEMEHQVRTTFIPSLRLVDEWAT